MKYGHYFKEENDDMFIMFFISIKNINHLSDEEIFRLLGYENVQKLAFAIHDTDGSIMYDGGDLHCYVVDDGEWLTIVDSCYELFHDFRNREKLEKLSYKYDVFYGTSGDIDESFDYTYYKDGVLRRKYEVSQANFRDLVVEKDIGIFLEGEKEMLLEKEAEKKVIHVARIAGISLKYNDSMRVYNLGFSPSDKYFLDEDEH